MDKVKKETILYGGLLTIIVGSLIYGLGNAPERDRIKKEKSGLVEQVYKKAKGNDNNFSFEEKVNLLKKLNVDLPLDSADQLILKVDDYNNYSLYVGAPFSHHSERELSDKVISDYLKSE